MTIFMKPSLFREVTCRLRTPQSLRYSGSFRSVCYSALIDPSTSQPEYKHDVHARHISRGKPPLTCSIGIIQNALSLQPQYPLLPAAENSPPHQVEAKAHATSRHFLSSSLQQRGRDQASTNKPSFETVGTTQWEEEEEVGEETWIRSCKEGGGGEEGEGGRRGRDERRGYR